jgi:predicted ATP-dependent serine protease
MLERLREKDKNGLFTPTQTSISYRTGFITFDYRNGYMVQVRDLRENLITEYPSIGIVGGTFVTIIGKSGTAKTTWAAQIAANIVKPYENAFVEHYDLEQSLSYTRIKNITHLTHAELNDKYILKQEKCFLEDIFDSITLIAEEKENNKADYIYDTGTVDEFNRPIKAYVPTVIIIDSIPTVASKNAKSEMEGKNTLPCYTVMYN